MSAPKALSIPPDEAAAVHEAFAINVASGSVSEFDLPRIKVMSGAALWLIPKLEGDETAPKIEGVIVFARDARVYYASKDAGNVPPDCSSTTRSRASRASPPGRRRVQGCPMAQWDSARRRAPGRRASR